MKTQTLNYLTIIAISLGGARAATAQNYAINWWKIAGGGGTSAGGAYQLSGTVGQSDASGALTGGLCRAQPVVTPAKISNSQTALNGVRQTNGMPERRAPTGFRGDMH